MSKSIIIFVCLLLIFIGCGKSEKNKFEQKSLGELNSDPQGYDTIILDNGDKIIGKIIQKTNDSYVLRSEDTEYTIHISQIKEVLANTGEVLYKRDKGSLERDQVEDDELINNYTSFVDEKYGFSIKLYPEYKRFRDSKIFITSDSSRESGGDLIKVDVTPCNKTERDYYMEVSKKGEYHPLHPNKSYIKKGSLQTDHFEMYFWVFALDQTYMWDYVLFPDEKHNYIVFISFAYPKYKDSTRRKQIENMIQTATNK